MGGEKSAASIWPSCCRGSPPHGRGKGGLLTAGLHNLGITPAWAGKSTRFAALAAFSWDHPRMGGEKFEQLFDSLLVPGSPPHGRGKGRIFPRGVGAQGITPAWAGKSPLVTRLYALAEDHPRMGGEKMKSWANDIQLEGSPPHGRGKAAASSRPSRYPRITPAWAGKSCMSRWSRGPGGDHPRMGGEKFAAAAAVAQRQGSPPHGRGKAAVERVWKQWPGITPAWAGKRAGREAP